MNKVFISPFLLSSSYSETTLTINVIFHEDLALFNYSVISAKFVFIFSIYSSAESPLKYASPSLSYLIYKCHQNFQQFLLKYDAIHLINFEWD